MVMEISPTRWMVPYYPFWALVIIGLDLTAIWALAAHGSAAAGPDTY